MTQRVAARRSFTRVAWLWAPPLLVAAAIFISSSSVPSFSPPAPDYVLHAIVYGLLGFLLFRAIGGGLRRAPGRGAALTGTAMAALYGVSDEIHQMFVPGRSPQISDAVADAVGAAAATGAAWLAIRAITRRGRALPRVTLYTRRDCHLCHEAREVLDRERQVSPFDLEVRDIDSDPSLRDEFGEQVPVVFLDGRKIFKFRVDPARLHRRLARSAGGGGLQ